MKNLDQKALQLTIKFKFNSNQKVKLNTYIHLFLLSFSSRRMSFAVQDYTYSPCQCLYHWLNRCWWESISMLRYQISNSDPRLVNPIIIFRYPVGFWTLHDISDSFCKHIVQTWLCCTSTNSDWRAAFLLLHLKYHTKSWWCKWPLLFNSLANDFIAHLSLIEVFSGASKLEGVKISIITF